MQPILILTDTDLKQENIPHWNQNAVQVVSTWEEKITSCCGCEDCWIKTPGKCRYPDAGVKICQQFAAATHLIVITKISFGVCSEPIQRVLERLRPIQKPFSEQLQKETVRQMRAVAWKEALFIGYGCDREEEKTNFQQLTQQYVAALHLKSRTTACVCRESVETVAEEAFKLWIRC